MGGGGIAADLSEDGGGALRREVILATKNTEGTKSSAGTAKGHLPIALRVSEIRAHGRVSSSREGDTYGSLRSLWLKRKRCDGWRRSRGILRFYDFTILRF